MDEQKAEISMDMAWIWIRAAGQGGWRLRLFAVGLLSRLNHRKRARTKQHEETNGDEEDTPADSEDEEETGDVQWDE